MVSASCHELKLVGIKMLKAGLLEIGNLKLEITRDA